MYTRETRELLKICKREPIALSRFVEVLFSTGPSPVVKCLIAYLVGYGCTGAGDPDKPVSRAVFEVSTILGTSPWDVINNLQIGLLKNALIRIVKGEDVLV